MVEKYTIRTDLAMEQKERFESDHVEVSGVVLEEEYDEEREIKITTVRIETENGAKMMGKPVGTYLTLEVPDMASADDGYHREISETLAGFLEKYVENEETKKEHSKEKGCSILTVGLGNREVTPDALGPYVVDQLNITRHMVQEYGRYGVEEESRIVSAIVPGVMARKYFTKLYTFLVKAVHIPYKSLEHNFILKVCKKCTERSRIYLLSDNDA